MKKPTGYVLYNGPSLIDGKPIMAIAITKSSNRKTGNMVQTYIMRSDVMPVAATRSGDDVSICGDCKQRPSKGGKCYVVVAQGPTVVWKGYKRGIYPNAESIANLGEGRMVRLGTYGDPAAVPAWIWEALVSKASGRTGYTHQWLNPALDQHHLNRIVALCMVSVDNPGERDLANDMGLRYFRTSPSDLSSPGLNEFVCPASEEAGKRKTCAECGACNGTRSDTDKRGSPIIRLHGFRAK